MRISHKVSVMLMISKPQLCVYPLTVQYILSLRVLSLIAWIVYRNA